LEQIRVKRRREKPKVAIYTEKAWAFGRNYTGLIKHMSEDYDFTWYDWRSQEEGHHLWHRDWQNYDIILSNMTYLLSGWLVESGWLPNGVPRAMLNKFVTVMGTPVLDHTHFRESFDRKYLYDSVVSAVCKEGVQNVENQENVKCYYTPPGVDTEHFYSTRNIKEIKTAGFVWSRHMTIDDPEISPVKRPQMFTEICDSSGMEPIFITGKSFTDNNRLYEDVDLLICCSLFEGAANPVFEAAACGIPVLSTSVGNVRELKNIKTFATADEAVEIIKELNSSEDLLREYVKNLSEEVRRDWNWEVLCEKYWKPLFEARLDKGGERE